MDPTQPPRLHGRSELWFLAVFSGILVVLGSFDLAGAVANWLDNSAFDPVGLSAVARFVVHTLGHAGDPTNGWPGPRHADFPAVVFWALLALLAGLLAGVAWFVRGRFRGRFDAPNEEGFASPGALLAAASLEAATARVPQTRPSLVGKPIRPADVGYPLGRTVRPKGIELRPSWEASLQLVAPPSAGKTIRVLAHVLRQHPGPAFATSTKADFYEVSAEARKRVSNAVYVLDPELLVPAAHRLRWSPVLGCKVTEVAERRAAALVAANGDNADVRSGAFFRQSAIAVLGAYLHAAALADLTMAEVVRWAARPTDPAPRRILTEQGDEHVDWASRLVEHTTGAEETTSGVMRTVDLALACFRHPEVLALCDVGEDEAFDFDAALGDNATVYTPWEV